MTKRRAIQNRQQKEDFQNLHCRTLICYGDEDTAKNQIKHVEKREKQEENIAQTW